MESQVCWSPKITIQNGLTNLLTMWLRKKLIPCSNWNLNANICKFDDDSSLLFNIIIYVITICSKKREKQNLFGTWRFLRSIQKGLNVTFLYFEVWSFTSMWDLFISKTINKRGGVKLNKIGKSIEKTPSRIGNVRRSSCLSHQIVEREIKIILSSKKILKKIIWIVITNVFIHLILIYTLNSATNSIAFLIWFFHFSNTVSKPNIYIQKLNLFLNTDDCGNPRKFGKTALNQNIHIFFSDVEITKFNIDDELEDLFFLFNFQLFLILKTFLTCLAFISKNKTLFIIFIVKITEIDIFFHDFHFLVNFRKYGVKVSDFLLFVFEGDRSRDFFYQPRPIQLFQVVDDVFFVMQYFFHWFEELFAFTRDEFQT